MEPLDRQHGEDAKVGHQNRPIEPGKLVNARESVVEKAARELIQCGLDEQRRQKGQTIHTEVRFCRTPARDVGTGAFTVLSIFYNAPALGPQRNNCRYTRLQPHLSLDRTDAAEAACTLRGAIPP